MLATVLNGEIAENQSIFIMRAFREMRHFIMNNERMFERINSIELKQLEYQKESEEKLNRIFDYIAEHKEDNQKIFVTVQNPLLTAGRSQRSQQKQLSKLHKR